LKDLADAEGKMGKIVKELEGFGVISYKIELKIFINIGSV